ncbi:hypothetical protein SELMODRAFT_418846 [Selaginella moellendorffii]|uniref:Uncharacterized protein n=1 Tax=Selaginella moellendorffii TaxID=88036 RepID=D8S6K3_SELML|nr:hypothetical protein SELMODRAFT_418846 [Selaginella moellendorffii]
MATEIAQLSPRSVQQAMALALNTDLKFHEWEARLSGRCRQGPPKETTRAGATQSGMPTPDPRKQCKGQPTSKTKFVVMQFHVSDKGDLIPCTWENAKDDKDILVL